MNQGTKMLRDVKLGDQVHVGQKIYEPIYTFGHFKLDARAEFLEIKTDIATLQLTQNHMVFSPSGAAVPAHMVKIGDELVNGNGHNMVVKSIKSTSSMGLVAPFTPSGKIVVDDVLASSFIGFDKSSHLSVWGIDISYQWLSHSFEFPHRFACTYITQCLEETYDEDGIPTWFSTARYLPGWMMKQGVFMKGLVGTLLASLFVIFNVVEFALLHPTSVCVGAFGIWKLMALGSGSKKL